MFQIRNQSNGPYVILLSNYVQIGLEEKKKKKVSTNV